MLVRPAPEKLSLAPRGEGRPRATRRPSAGLGRSCAQTGKLLGRFRLLDARQLANRWKVLTLNSSLGRKQAQLNGETPEGLAQILLDELAREGHAAETSEAADVGIGDDGMLRLI